MTLRPRGPLAVLLVGEDDEERPLIREALEIAGVSDLRTFRSGRALLDFLSPPSSPPPLDPGTAVLVLLDISPSPEDGVEILRRLKNEPSWRRFPVMVLSATETPEIVLACYRGGCSAYISKPSEPEAFSEALRHLGFFLLIMEIPPAV